MHYTETRYTYLTDSYMVNTLRIIHGVDILRGSFHRALLSSGLILSKSIVHKG